MAILWCGGEDIDFPNGAPVGVTTVSGRYASGARCAITSPTGMAKSLVYPGMTSGWLSCHIYSVTAPQANKGFFGAGSSGSDKGLFVGIGASTGKLALLSYDGSTWTVLASEAGTSFSSSTLHRLDFQLINYGASSTVNIFLNGVLLITYSGSTSISGVSSFDSLYIYSSNAGSYLYYLSGVIVADEDTRTMSVVPLVPNAAGDALTMTGAYTTVDDVSIDDADLVYGNTVGHQALYGLSGAPAGTFVVKALRIAARAAKSSGSTPTSLNLGYKSGGSVNVSDNHALTTGWATYERMITSITDPAAVDALQVALELAA